MHCDLHITSFPWSSAPCLCVSVHFRRCMRAYSINTQCHEIGCPQTAEFFWPVQFPPDSSPKTCSRCARGSYMTEAVLWRFWGYSSTAAHARFYATLASISWRTATLRASPRHQGEALKTNRYSIGLLLHAQHPFTLNLELNRRRESVALRERNFDPWPWLGQRSRVAHKINSPRRTSADILDI